MSKQYVNKALALGGVGLKVVTLLAFVYAIFTAMNWAVQRSIDTYNSYASLTTVTLKERERQLQCLAQNIYWEAASEPFEGKVAVAQVTINRAESGKFPNDICQVVYQKNVFYEKVVCQFSWYCERNHKVKPVHTQFYSESEAVAKKVLLEGFRLDGLKEAMYYHADYVNPKWKKEKVATIGRHIFYKE
jgi:spore germination cell wall hydrolase CwlJ-like protein